MEEKPVYPDQFYKINEGDITMGTTPTAEVVKGKLITGWTIEDEDLVKILNSETLEDPKLVKIAKDLGDYEAEIKDLLLQFKYVFIFTYKDMKGIPPYVCEHKIELQPETKPIRQMRYRMNPNYTTKVKNNLTNTWKPDLYTPLIKRNGCHLL